MPDSMACKEKQPRKESAAGKPKASSAEIRRADKANTVEPETRR